jgi:hypothetical protein
MPNALGEFSESLGDSGCNGRHGPAHGTLAVEGMQPHVTHSACCVYGATPAGSSALFGDRTCQPRSDGDR